MTKPIDYSFLAITLLLNCLSQIIMRWQMAGEVLPEGILPKIPAALKLLFKPWVLVALFCTFVSGISWMITLTKFELSYAYPFTAALYALMLTAGWFFFGETVTPTRILGTTIIIFGVVLVSM
jgi:drug/metabolite transporter (DMT)-like permease